MMKQEPLPEWKVHCPDCNMKPICDEWGCPSECTKPIPNWIKTSINANQNKQVKE